jgi:putative transposase
VNVICEEWKVSIRRVCGALEFDRSTFHYRSRKPDQAGIEARIKAICETRIRYGYRRVHVMLQREGGASTSREPTGFTMSWVCS